MFEHVTVKEWMIAPVFSVRPNTPISEAHQLMKDKKVRRLPVLRGDELVGIVTIGDVREASPSGATTLSIWELNYLWSQLTVEKVMSKRVLTVTPAALMLDAAEIMLEHKISGLPVVENHKLVGMITESDIFRMLVKSRRPEILPS
jgi:acetoin utilization protein AcuB